MNKTKIKDELEGIVGDENIFTELAERIPYRFGNVVEYRLEPPDFLPDYVVKASSTKQISEILRLANKFNIPVVPWGGGTDFTGANSPIKGGIVVDMKEFNEIEINTEEQYVRAGAGTVLLRITEEAEKNGFLFPHEITTQPSATLGGAIATNSFGHRSSSYRNIRSLILGIEVVLPTGEIIKSKPLFKTSMGYDPISLLVGSEGTLGIITEATMRLIPAPETREFSFYLFDSFEDGFTAAKDIHGNLTPEFFDLVELSFLKYSDYTVDFLMNYIDSALISSYLHSRYIKDSIYGNILDKLLSELPSTKKIHRYLKNTIHKKSCLSVMTIGFEGDKETIRTRTRIVEKIAREHGGLKFSDETYYEKRFRSFEKIMDIVYSQKLPLSKQCLLTLDITVPVSKINNMKNSIHNLVQRYEEIQLLDIDFYSSLTTLGIDLLLPVNKSKIHKGFFKELNNTVLQLDGSLSFAHGVGIRLLPHIEEEVGKEYMSAIQKIKKAFDPNNILNPGKLGDGP